MNILGQRFRIVAPDHPWVGHSGEVVKFGNTLAGPGIVLRLDDPKGQETFVFSPEDVAPERRKKNE